jgi:hypothetical protein
MSEQWEEDSLTLKSQYLAGSSIPGSGGVNINDIQIRLKVIVLQGMRSFADGSTKKVFGKGEADIPLQMALFVLHCQRRLERMITMKVGLLLNLH